MYLHIGENQTVLQADIVAIVPLFVGDKEHSAIFIADGTVVMSSISARTLHARAEGGALRDH